MLFRTASPEKEVQGSYRGGFHCFHCKKLGNFHSPDPAALDAEANRPAQLPERFLLGLHPLLVFREQGGRLLGSLLCASSDLAAALCQPLALLLERSVWIRALSDANAGGDCSADLAWLTQLHSCLKQVSTAVTAPCCCSSCALCSEQAKKSLRGLDLSAATANSPIA